jgi:hypothetical protein
VAEHTVVSDKRAVVISKISIGRLARQKQTKELSSDIKLVAFGTVAAGHDLIVIAARLASLSFGLWSGLWSGSHIAGNGQEENIQSELHFVKLLS